MKNLKKNKQAGPEQINKYQMYIKFVCANEKVDSLTIEYISGNFF